MTSFQKLLGGALLTLYVDEEGAYLEERSWTLYTDVTYGTTLASGVAGATVEVCDGLVTDSDTPSPTGVPTYGPTPLAVPMAMIISVAMARTMTTTTTTTTITIMIVGL